MFIILLTLRIIEHFHQYVPSSSINVNIIIICHAHDHLNSW